MEKDLDFWLRRLLTLFLPLVAVVAAYLTLPHAVATRPLPFLAYLLTIVYFVHYAGKILWRIGVEMCR